MRDEKGLYPLADENFEKNLNLSSAEKIFLKSRMGINLMGSRETMAKTWKEICFLTEPLTTDTLRVLESRGS